MPDRAHRECCRPRCPNYAVDGGYCAAHRRHDREVISGPKGANLRPQNRRFQRQRHSFLMRHPMCAMCRIAPASILDHIVPHRGDFALFWNQRNWQSLCITCHGRKTARETLNPEASVFSPQAAVFVGGRCLRS